MILSLAESWLNRIQARPSLTLKSLSTALGRNCDLNACELLPSLIFIKYFSMKQFNSVAPSCLSLCDPMDRGTPGLPVRHQLPGLAQTHVHCVSDAVQQFHPLLFPSPPAFNLSQHQGLFQRVRFSHQVAKVLELQLQHQSFQWIFRTDFL